MVKENYHNYHGVMHKDVELTVAVYKYDEWNKLQKMENPTCKQKKEMAFRQLVYHVPLDGSDAGDS